MKKVLGGIETVMAVILYWLCYEINHSNMHFITLYFIINTSERKEGRKEESKVERRKEGNKFRCQENKDKLFGAK